MKKTSILIAVALFIIAANMTYQNFFSKPKQEAKLSPKAGTTEVVKVIGKYLTQYDGLEDNKGFLVEGKDGLSVIDFDEGSIASSVPTPEYLTLYWPENGSDKPYVMPALVRDPALRSETSVPTTTTAATAKL